MLKFSLVVLFLVSAVSGQGSVINDAVCDRQLAYFENALETRERWAIFMFDTWAKLQSSVLRGNRDIPGGFADCVSFRHESNLSEIGMIQGKHCMINFRPTANASEIDRSNGFDWKEVGKIARENNLSFRHGFCLPATCSNEKVIEFMTQGYLAQGDFEGTAARCQTNNPVKYEALDIFAIVLFSAIGLLLVASTAYEIIKIKQEREPNQLLASFSVYTNGWKLYDVLPSKSPSDIRCMHGIRALSILYIMIGHRYGLPMWNVISNNDALTEWQTNFHLGFYHTHQVAVDVFFMMGGLLVTWSTLRSLDNNRLNILRSILHRYLRYTPLLAALVLFLVTLMKHVVFAPMSYLEGGMWNIVPNCQKWWWTTLLHVQNYVNPTEICMSHTWYLSIDFQLFIISPFLIYPAWKFGWKYVWVFPTLAFLNCIYLFVMSMVYKVWLVTKTEDAADFDFFLTWIYYPTHARMGPWFTGMFLGYIMYQNRRKKVEMNPILNAAVWILCLTVFAAITMGSQIMFMPPDLNDTTLLANAFYTGFYRNSWALASAWMIFACHNGTGGIIKWFLELPQWQPIGRMGLSMYLLSFMFQHFHIMNAKQPYYFDEFDMIHLYWGDIVASILISTVGYLAFEVPFLTVESYIYKKIQNARKKVTKI